MRSLTRSQRSALTSRPANSRQTKRINLKYHRLRCQICRHASCQQIEEAFLQWRSPKVIMHSFGIKTETTIYHHAHALGLFNLRNQNLTHALGNIIEEADTVRPTTKDILRAIHALAHINDQGQWVHPTNKSEITVSGPSSARSSEANSIASETKSKAGAGL
jgi:hypothetical protein